MLISIEGVRPALISNEAYKHFDEIRGFRHVFRHAYSHGLDDERVFFLLRKVLNNRDFILNELKNFEQKIENMYHS
jgi:uncharacterized protein YutE (UPF0331/DUF86 family)